MLQRQKSRLMLETEAKLGRTLEDALPELLQAKTMSEVARDLGLSRSTIYYWSLRFRVKVDPKETTGTFIGGTVEEILGPEIAQGIVRQETPEIQG